MRVRLLALLAVVIIAAGCSPGPMSKPGRAAPPMNKPVALGDDPSSGNVELVRRRLFS